jgi:hypothetical protein
MCIASLGNQHLDGENGILGKGKVNVSNAGYHSHSIVAETFRHIRPKGNQYPLNGVYGIDGKGKIDGQHV